MGIIVYWLEQNDNEFFGCYQESHFKPFSSIEITEALAFAHRKRKENGVNHVVISSELDENIGKNGVSSVENGKLPDGSGYGWTKRRV